jgi:hypothetical protein
LEWDYDSNKSWDDRLDSPKSGVSFFSCLRGGRGKKLEVVVTWDRGISTSKLAVIRNRRITQQIGKLFLSWVGVLAHCKTMSPNRFEHASYLGEPNAPEKL